MARIKALAILIALTGTAATTAATQSGVPPATVRLPEGTTELEIPFELYRRWMVVPVRIEESPALVFILDTGAPITVLADIDRARSLPLSIIGQVAVAGVGEGEAPTVPVAGNVSLSIGELRISDAVMALGVGKEAIAGADGIIGRPLFRNLVVEIDWAGRMLRLTDPDTFEYTGAGVELPLSELASGHLTTRARIGVGEGGTREVSLLVDTGAGHALSVEPSALEGLGQPAHLLSDVVIGWGSNGMARGDIGRLASVDLGGHVLHEVITSFPDAQPWHSIGEALQADLDGNLGSQILQRFRVTFDVPHGRLYLEPNDTFLEPFRFDGTGLGLAPWAPGTDSVRIADVVRGSPADEAGIQAGDEITAIGGREVAEMSVNDVKAMLEGEPGDRLHVLLRRGSEVFERQLTLRRLI